jgi:hypothetical protein
LCGRLAGPSESPGGVVQEVARVCVGTDCAVCDRLGGGRLEWGSERVRVFVRPFRHGLKGGDKLNDAARGRELFGLDGVDCGVCLVARL